MKFFLLTATVLLTLQINCVFAQEHKCSSEELKQCFDKGKWREGLKYTPHSSINKEEFIKQYHSNKNLWDKAFQYLRETNLDSIKPGKYPIVGDSVYASVTENLTKELNNSKWEFHKKYIDLQMVIKGTEKMGVAPLSKTGDLEPYNETKDVGFVSFEEGDYYKADEGVFFLFFPAEAHRPSLKTDDCLKNKKIVIKIRAN